MSVYVKPIILKKKTFNAQYRIHSQNKTKNVKSGRCFIFLTFSILQDSIALALGLEFAYNKDVSASRGQFSVTLNTAIDRIVYIINLLG